MRSSQQTDIARLGPRQRRFRIDTLRYYTGLCPPFLIVGGSGLLLIALGIDILVQGGPQVTVIPLLIGAFITVAVAIIGFFVFRSALKGIDLYRDGLVVRCIGKTAVIPWDQMAAITSSTVDPSSPYLETNTVTKAINRLDTPFVQYVIQTRIAAGMLSSEYVV